MSAAAPQPVFRFAPSPNGRLHLGHALSALENERRARAAGGRLLLRIEDVDRQRCRPHHEALILEDLAWLGIRFDGAVRRQSEHGGDHRAALDRLLSRGLAYRSVASRSMIAACAAADPAWPHDPEGAPHAPGADAEARMRPGVAPDGTAAIRLDIARAAALAGPLTFLEDGTPVPCDPRAWGDPVLLTRDGSFSYHLAVVVDDALQGVTHVVRGRDLFAQTSIHRVLQAALGLPAPHYHHHRLVTGDDGLKLSKSREAPALADLRAEGVTAAEIRARLGFAPAA